MKTLKETALEYARAHLQPVKICWVDKSVSLCDARESVELCADFGTAARIVGVITRDATMQSLLERLIDRD